MFYRALNTPLPHNFDKANSRITINQFVEKRPIMWKWFFSWHVNWKYIQIIALVALKHLKNSTCRKMQIPHINGLQN